MRKVKARKKYKCDITNRDINVGDTYIRVNIRGVGVYHFHQDMEEHEIKNHVYPDIFYAASPEQQDRMCHPLNYDSFDQDVWKNMPEEH